MTNVTDVAATLPKVTVEVASKPVPLMDTVCAAPGRTCCRVDACDGRPGIGELVGDICGREATPAVVTWMSTMPLPAGTGTLKLSRAVKGHGGGRHGAKATVDVWVKPVPLMVTILPVGPDAGLMLVTVGDV